jgi:hypothetical protein
VSDAEARLGAAGVETSRSNGTVVVHDPSGNRMVLTAS